MGTADEVKTVIGYGAQTAGTANNLLPVSTAAGAGDGSLTATTTVAYDPAGNRTTVDGPLSGSADTARTLYNANREVIGAISADPDGAGAQPNLAQRITYGADGQPTKVELGTTPGQGDSDWAAFSPSQQSVTTYDANGRKTADLAQAAGGSTYALTQYSYDALGRQDCIAVRMNGAAWGSLPASACTAQTAGTDGPDRISKATYNAASELTKVQSGYGVSGVQADDRAMTYNANGTAATLTDAENNRTSLEYDGHDRLVKTIYPSSTKGAGTSNASDYEQLTYEAGGNVTSRRLRDGNVIGLSYDALNRLTTKDLPGAELDVGYSYDLLGRPLTVATSAQTITLGYDALGRALTEPGPLGTVTAAYDLAGRRTPLTYPGGGFYLTYEHDVAGNLLTIRENGSTALASYAYDSLGRRTSLTRGNGVVTSYSYDAVSRLTTPGLDLVGTGDDLSLGFGYNAASQIKSTTRSNTGYSWTGAVNVDRSYSSNGLNGAVRPIWQGRRAAVSAGK